MKIILKYLGYFSAATGAIYTIYLVSAFFVNMQNSIEKTMNTSAKIELEQTNQSEKIKSIEYEVIQINAAQSKQKSFNFAIDKSWSDHLKKSKDLIDEYTKYLELQIQEEKKKNFRDSVMLKIDHSFSIQKK
jgi:uncharacterized membrane protein YhiD involved in acid resistance